MAQLKVKDEWVGPGEQRTAEHLRDVLPDDWVIFAGRKLAGENRDDVDLIVVGKSKIFVLDEKSWGPTVVVDDSYWYVGNSPRPNPLGRVGQLARKVAGKLREGAKGYSAIHGKRVVPGVVLSNQKLQILTGKNHDSTEHVWPLVSAAEHMVTIDATDSHLGIARGSVLAYLDDLPSGGKVLSLGEYVVDGRLAIAGVEQAFSARDTSGQQVVLKCYSPARLEDYGDPTLFLERETRSLNHLAESQRAWRALPHFYDPAHELFVVPVIQPRLTRSLAVSQKKCDPERPSGRLDDGVARTVLIDAFSALAEVHEYGLIHRALHPSRIWLGRALRVMFSDFHLARIDGAQSIATWEPDADQSEDYRAPECAVSVGLATPKSDVFSLSLCMLEWLVDRPVSDIAHDDVREVVMADFPWAIPVLDALRPAADRPSASDLVAALTPPVSEPAPAVGDDEFAIGEVVAGRYEIQSMLGEGGFATSWKVFDKQAEHLKVLKQFKRAVPEHLRSEYLAGNMLTNDRCGRVYDVQVHKTPAYLVSEYVDGANLQSSGSIRSVDEIRTIARNVLLALAYIHGKDLVHGDVTPGNIIVTLNGSGEAKLIDFGLATASGERPVGSTPLFASPEVREGKPATPSSDLFGFAASMSFAMLNRHATRYSDGVLQAAPPTESELEAWGEDGASLLRSLQSGLLSSPSDRPQSADQFLTILDAATAVETSPPSGAEGFVPVHNPNVDALRRLYRGSVTGNAGNRGLDDEYAKQTYVPTKLDTELLPRVINGELDVVLLSGNPGDGKTSVLVRLGDQLKEMGASIEHEDDAGWRLALDGRTFVAVFDASESHGELSSDELVRNALDLVAAGGNATALIAVNDGRLLQFFTDNGDRYEEWSFAVQDQLEGRGNNLDRLALVDLKQRSLAGVPGEPGPALRVLNALTDAEQWNACLACAAQHDCPILANRNALRAPSIESFDELVRISHLRRRRRSTFRDLRSAIAWLITGDRSCDDIHSWRSEGRSAMLMENATVSELAFDSSSDDYLVREWASLDPSQVPAPEVDRLFRTAGAASKAPELQTIESTARAVYFGTIAAVPPKVVRTYRYLDEFTAMLSNGGHIKTIPRLLSGLSRLVGAFGYASEGLAMSSGMPDATWAVLHTVSPIEFSVHVDSAGAEYVEMIPDRLTLRHGSSGPTLALTLDTAEIILRAADGELINDLSTDAILQEIDSFVSQLARHPSSEARIVNASGSVAVAQIAGTKIVLQEHP